MISLKKLIEEIEENKGLWANIHAKRKRGEKPAKKGSEAYKKAKAAGKKISKESTCECESCSCGDKIKESKLTERVDYKYLTQVILDANPKHNVYYNSGHNKVNIGGVGYDKGDLVQNFNQKPGSSSKIKNNFYYANQDPENTKKEVEKLSRGKIKVDIQKGYGGKPVVVYIVKEGKLTEAKFYVTYNQGRGMGKRVVTSKESDYEKPRVFKNYNDAEKYVKRAKSGGGTPGRITAYWVSDINMNRIDKSGKIVEAEYQGRDVKLNKPTRGDTKKFKVYVNTGKKNKDGSMKVKKVEFGARGSENRIKKSDPARRKNFRARHNCDNPGPKTKARYWSCKKW